MLRAGGPARAWWALALVALIAVALATACGDDDDDDAGAAADSSPATAAAAETTAAAATTGGSTVERLAANASAFRYAVGKRGGSLKLVTISDPLTFNLAIAEDASSADVLSYVFEGLTEVSWLTNEVEPALAESWEVSEDGLTWTFRLRTDVAWHDETPFTARDVAFTFNDILYNEAIPAAERPSFIFRYLNEAGDWEEARMSVEVIDDYTVRFVLPTPFAPFLRFMGTAIYPQHILGPAVEAGTFAETWGIETPPAEIIGTGPFRIVSYEPGAQVLMVRSPNYWMRDSDGAELPYLNTIEHVIVEDQAAELAAFRAGESDLYAIADGSEFEELQLLQEEGNFTIARRGPTFGTTFLTFNLNSRSDAETGEPFVAPEKLAWFQSLDFRRAVSHAIDRAGIIDEVLDGLGYEHYSAISPAAGDFHNPDVLRFSYNVEEAKRLLDGAGFMDRDGDGIREDADGNPIAFTIRTNEGNTHRQQMTALIQRNLQAVGLQVEVAIEPFGDLVQRITSTYVWEAIVIGLTGGTEPHGGINVWHSTGPLHIWHPDEPATPWEAEVDALYVAGGQELDRERRVSIYHRAQAIIAENLPLIYTVLPERLSAMRNVFGNTTPTLYGLFDIRYLYRLDQ